VGSAPGFLLNFREIRVYPWLKSDLLVNPVEPMSTNPTMAGRVPLSDAERSAFRAQLERILKSPLFLHSKHYQDFLHYVVEKTLEGNAETLKERTLGIDVFGRDPMYDTKLDNVVRNTSTRVRKRLAQYYGDREHAAEPLIELPPGSYVPVFSPHSERPRALAPFLGSRTQILRYCAFLIIVIVGIIGWYFLWYETAIHRFWKPALRSAGMVTICVGTAGRSYPQLSSGNAGREPSDAADPGTASTPNLSFEDATALARLSAFLTANGAGYIVRKDALTTLADLKNGPTILIGAFNNQWTLRLTSELRYTFQKDFAAHLLWISDRQNSASRDWSSDDTLPVDQITSDYGIITRIFDPTTRRFIVVVAGLRKYGTAAASMFLIDQNFIESFSQQLPAGWPRKSLQMVFATRVINGVPGAPRILAVHAW
jgi:hypothetical protein